MKSIACVILAFELLLSGCTKSLTVVRFIDIQYPASESVEIYQIPPQGHDYVQIARLSVRGSGKTRQEAPKLFAQKAKELGADAIILLGEAYVGTYMLNPRLGAAINEYSAIAIKFK